MLPVSALRTSMTLPNDPLPMTLSSKKSCSLVAVGADEDEEDEDEEDDGFLEF
jgi:hypothetical protein